MVARPVTRTSTSVREAPAHSTSVSLSEIASGMLRMDAAAYGIQRRRAVQILEVGGAFSLLDEYSPLRVDIQPVLRTPRVWVSNLEFGIPFFSSSDIISLKPVPKGLVSRKVTQNLGGLICNKWDVLVSRSGTVGNVLLAGDSFDGAAND